MKTVLVWFKNDLRLHDNEALKEAIQECDELIFCYAIEKSNFKKLDIGFRKCDINRLKFMQQSVVDLQTHLLIGSDSAVQFLSELVEKYDISDFYAEDEYASGELDLIRRIQEKLPEVKFHFYWGKTLYHKDDIPFSISKITLSSKAYRILAGKESEFRKTLKHRQN